MDKLDKVTVVISGEQRIRYRQTVVIPRERYEEYERLCDEGNIRKIDQIFGEYIDPLYVYDSDDIEEVEVDLGEAAP